MIKWVQQSLFSLLPGFSGSTVAAKSASKPTSKTDPDSHSNSMANFTTESDLRIVAKPRLRKGWKLEWTRQGATLSIPALLLEAPPEIHQALRAWTRLVRRGRRFQNANRPLQKELENRVHAWMESWRNSDPKHVQRASAQASRRLDRLNPRGKHHDLTEILARINAEYFGGKLEARITWSHRWGGLSTQCTQRDGAGNPYPLITISRGYDHPSATAEIVGGVVYHECLHIVIPPRAGTQRRLVHGREFRLREKEYRQYAAWQQWHREVLPRILRRAR